MCRELQKHNFAASSPSKIQTGDLLLIYRWCRHCCIRLLSSQVDQTPTLISIPQVRWLGSVLLRVYQTQSDARNSSDRICAGYLAALHESRTFNCPDCVDAMAEAFGVAAAVSQLRVRSSTKHCQTPSCSSMTCCFSNFTLQRILATLYVNAGIRCELSAEQ